MYFTSRVQIHCVTLTVALVNIYDTCYTRFVLVRSEVTSYCEIIAFQRLKNMNLSVPLYQLFT
jgi:hypothetical protein